ncbi:MAG: malectin domain-containing carbohydrate-binding protein, partial [Cyanobacteria bacterium P01_A01_bin.80]
LYRVNAGGGEVAAIDGEIAWSADTKTNNSPFLVDNGSNSSAAFSAVEPGANVPLNIPGIIFDSERWNQSGGSEMQWAFDVPESGEYEVRLYMGNGFSGTSDPGERIFDVAVEGSVPTDLDDIDLSSQFGHEVGAVISNTVEVTDGTLNLEFIHGVENPLINGIEIVQLGV